MQLYLRTFVGIKELGELGAVGGGGCSCWRVVEVVKVRVERGIKLVVVLVERGLGFLEACRDARLSDAGRRGWRLATTYVAPVTPVNSRSRAVRADLFSLDA